MFDPRYREILERFPLYTRDDEAMLAEKIKDLLSCGEWLHDIQLSY